MSQNNIYNKEMLLKELRAMGIQSTDALLVHSSMKSIGQVEGRANTVIDALMECVSDGMLMFPTHTWAQMSEEYNVYNPATEKACTGILPNIFMNSPRVVRSLHPTHSMAVWGKKVVADSEGNKRLVTAEEYIRGEENVNTPCAPTGCWGRLLEIDAKILLLGVNHIKNTYIHAVEEMLDVPERLTENPVSFKIVMPDETLKEVAVHRHYNRHTAHISEEFVKLTEAFETRGVAHNFRLGDADCILCDARGLYEVTAQVLSHEINCIIDRKEIPREWWEK